MSGLALMPRTLKLCLAAALAALLLFGGFKLYSLGSQAATAEWSVKYEKLQGATREAARMEANRTLTANLEAQREATFVADAHAAELAQRDTLIKELEDEAMADATAGRACLGAASVQRIQRAAPGSR